MQQFIDRFFQSELRFVRAVVVNTQRHGKKLGLNPEAALQNLHSMFLNNLHCRRSKRQNLRRGQRDMNPIAIDAILAAFPPLPAVLHNPTSNLVSVIPDSFRFFPRQPTGSKFVTDEEITFLLRLYNFTNSLEGEIKHRTALKLHIRIAEIKDRRFNALAKHLLNGIVTNFEGLEAKCMKHALLRRGKNPNRCFSDNAKAALTTDEKRFEIDTGGRLRHGSGAEDFAVRQNGFESEDLLAHGAVESAAVPHTIGGNGASHRGNRQCPGVMAKHEIVSVQSFLQRFQNRA